jgi:hypothetical protein
LGSKTLQMKVFSDLTLKKTSANHSQTPVLTYLSLSLLVLSLFVLLTACDDRKATSTVTTRAAATTPTKTTINAPVVAPAGQVATAPTASQPAYSNNQPLPYSQATIAPDPNDTFTSPVADQPTIAFSPEIVMIGQSVEISGKGYPANTRLNIRLASADFKADGLYASVLTDETGAFTTSLDLENAANTGLLTPGKLEIAVTTPDNRVGASAPLALQPASNTPQDEVCKNLVLEFFNTLKRNPSLAQVYLSTELRGQVSAGKTSLNGLLGTDNPPLRVEVTKVNEAADSYRATLFFSGGDQKSVVLDVSTDVSGALKISAMRAFNISD